MPLAYEVHEVLVSDPEAYAEYARLAAPTVAAHGGRYIVRGGNGVAIAGDAPAARVVILEFPDRETAVAWRASPEYQAALKIREAASTSRVYLVDGFVP
ncbi:DUF1330 domain-containing protein [Brevundimonas staleyi]|uniref:DUF1330 domain-containing protein n=1 Tax=Brevundimonas staleyi TaxID=74326 RepID=A0ABW0FXK4_9CAUL